MVPNAFLFPCICVPFMYLSLPFMFISFAFDLYVLSFWKKNEFPRMFVSFFFHDLPCLLMFLFSFLLLPTFFYFLFTLLYFNAFHFLPLSFHARYFPCPSILCSYPFIVPPCHVQNFIDRIFGMRDRGRHGGHTLYV